MTRHQAVLFRQLLLTIDVLLSAAAFMLALSLRSWIGDPAVNAAMPGWLRVAFDVPPVLVEDYYNLFLPLLPVWGFSFHWAKTSDFRQPYRRTVLRHAKAVGVGLGLLVAGSFLFKIGFIARTFVLMFGVIQLAILSVGRVLLLETVAAVRRQHMDGHRVLIVGCGEAALLFARSLQRDERWNNRLVGHVAVPGEHAHPDAVPVVTSLDEMSDLLDTEPVDEVVFAVKGFEPEKFETALHACDERGVDVLLTMPQVVATQGKVEIANVTGFDMPLLGMTRTPTDQGRLAVKRLLDIASSALGLLLVAPVLALVAIAIKLDSKGPVLFKQVRAGRHGRKFTMYKFRSMVTDAEELRAKLEHLNEMDGPVFKIKHDPRITRVGRLIRATSIDELPQLFNIFLGDMSLVGPRPPLPSEVSQYEPRQRRRLSVKPGLTGLWQVSGRNQVDFDQWMKLDLEYIDNWSLWLDLKIIFRTVPAVLRGTGS
jgi:exopolysaccharide biosynthesis polyprenyl glycosylphosphotransferase